MASFFTFKDRVCVVFRINTVLLFDMFYMLFCLFCFIERSPHPPNNFQFLQFLDPIGASIHKGGLWGVVSAWNKKPSSRTALISTQIAAAFSTRQPDSWFRVHRPPLAGSVQCCTLLHYTWLCSVLSRAVRNKNNSDIPTLLLDFFFYLDPIWIRRTW